VKTNKLNLPLLRNSQNYIGLYVIDFGDHSGIGFTADEVAELLESERFKDIKVYKIHNAYPDGKVELRGVRNELFELEMGMFFYADSLETARDGYRELLRIAVSQEPPTRAKVHLAKYNDEKFVVALIYPAEHNDEFSSWLDDSDYHPQGRAAGGISLVQQYYTEQPEIIERQQLLGEPRYESRTGEELLMAAKVAVQR
jgi:hypothetical protein